jgi:mercuric reductase
MSNTDFDLAVIGAGSAGFSAAITAAEQGARVALIGHGTIGGTCVNIGCVPSKALIRAAEALHQTRTAGRFAGIRAEASLADWSALVAQKDALVAELRTAKYADLLPEYDGIAYIEGAARLVPDGVAVNGGVVGAGRTVIASGASPALPDIPGIAEVPYLTSTTAMELPSLPASLAVIGGGFVGCELGQMFARMGVRVTILCRSRLLPDAEPEISEALAGYLGAEGIAVHTGVSYGGIRLGGAGIELAFSINEREQHIETEQILIAAGVAPNTGGLGLEDAGIALAPGGGVRVDDRLRTTRDGTYAAGDVTGRDMHVYMAAYGGRIAAENALNGDSQAYDAAAMPEVVFTDPQAASVGLTEAAARAAGYSVKTSVLPLEFVPRALAARDTRGLIKLVADAASDRLVGAHILAPEGGDSIQTAALAIKAGMTARQLGSTIFPYLTTVEGLKLAAQAFENDIAKLSCCAG